MVKKLENTVAYQVGLNGKNYIVNLERLTNTKDGCPRFKAIIIDPSNLDYEDWTRVFTFKGHYMSNRQEAEWICQYWLDGFKK